VRVLVDLLFFSGTRGGAETYVREVYSRLGNSEIEFVAFASSEFAAADTSWFPGKVIDSGISGRNRLLWARGELMEVARAAQREGADLIHSPANLGPVRSKVPVVLTLHDMVSFRHPEWVPTRAVGWFLRWMIRGAARNARLIITDSQAAEFDIHDMLNIPKDRIAVVVLAGSDTSTPSATASPRQAGLIFSPGNRMPHKGLSTLIEALSLIPPARRPTLALTASTPRDPLRAVAERFGVSDSIQFNGWLTRAELDSLYADATLVVFPTMFEGFGLPLLEGMSHGAPVLCSDLAVLREVGGNAAEYVEAGSASALAAAIDALLQDPARREQLVAAGWRRVALYSWSSTAVAFDRALRRALS
jgi:glycosyltransferase involved in cell wall biosynthesis